MPPARPAHPERVERMSAVAADPALVRERLAGRALPVGRVAYLADRPDKHHEGVTDGGAPGLASLLSHAEREVLLQTPYLVLSDRAVEVFRELRARPRPRPRLSRTCPRRSRTPRASPSSARACRTSATRAT